MAATFIPLKRNIPKRTGPNLFRILLVICQLICAAPVIGPSKQFHRKLHCTWCFIFMSTLLYAVYTFQGYILLANKPTIQKGFNFSVIIGSTALVLLSIFTSYGHSDCYKTLPDQIQEIERRTRLYQRKGLSHQTRHNIDRKAAGILLIASAFYAGILVTIFSNEKNFPLFLRNSVVFVLPNVNIHLFLGQYWVLMRFATLRCKELNAVLEELNDERPYCSLLLSNSNSRGDASAVIDELRIVYAQLDSLVGKIHDIFGLAITVNFLISFLTLSVQIFKFYTFTDRGDIRHWPEIVFTLIWMMMHFCKFVFILNVNSSLLNEKAKTGSILNNIDTEEIQTDDAITRFLLQLVVRKNIHVVCGVIDLDMSLLGGILSALSIYVIFLIQIDLSDVTLIERAVANVTTMTTPKGTL